MNKKYWLGTLIVMLLASLSVQKVSAQSNTIKKFLPILSLQNPVPNSDPEAPAEQTISEPGPGEKRYLIMPVFMKNGLEQTSYKIGDSVVTGEPIYSFQFKLQYNKTHLRYVGVQKRGPLYQDSTVLAKDFVIGENVSDDPTYKVQTTSSPSLFGSRVMFDASSSTPLPLSRALQNNPQKGNWDVRGWSVLFWVKFEVICDQFGNNLTGGFSSGIDRDQVIISRDSIRYGGNHGKRYDPVNIDTAYMVPYGFERAPASRRSIDVVYPSLPPGGVVTYPNDIGARTVWIVARPEIDLRPSSIVRTINGDSTNWEVILPLRTWYKNSNNVSRQLILLNQINRTELTNLEVQSDANWLRVDTNITPSAGGSGTPLERGYQIRNVGQQKIVNIIANPSLLANSKGENPGPADYPAPGFYTGYLTFKSADAINSAMRVKVTLVVYRNPLEPNLKYDEESQIQRGIQLLVRNSAPVPDTTYLTFGTGKDASDGLDTLFGEVEAPEGDVIMSNKFDARWFPTNEVKAKDGSTHENRGFYDERDDVPDLRYDLNDTRQPNTGATPKPTIDHNSIDIRNYKSDTTLVYCAKFSAGNPNYYPISIEFDLNDLPQGAIAIIKDNVNGTYFNADLRNATDLGGTRRAFYIRDPNIKGFCIEYTLPNVAQFPEMKNGWNFVSMPVNPANPNSRDVFANCASGLPISFTQAQYQDNEKVTPGVGYFVKYVDNMWTLDQYVSGNKVKAINANTTPYKVKVYQGWNTVGGLSYPTTTSSAYLTFSPIGGLANPQRLGEVYRYLTDRGYEQASVIAPGYGYWIKVSNSGYYNLSAPAGSFGKEAPAVSNDYTMLNKLTLSDNSSKVGTVYFGSTKINDTKYELPPVPANDAFDVRFGNGAFVSSNDNVSGNHLLNINGAKFPIAINVTNADANYDVVDAASGEVYGSIEQGKNSKVVVSNPFAASLKLVSKGVSAISVSNALPNPAQGNVSFNISMPTEEFVKVKLMNSIGSDVKTLFEGNVNGTKMVEFSVEGLPSGVYYYTMTTSSGVKEVRQLVVSK